MWYVLIAAILIMTALLVLRLRLRAEIGTRQRWLFVGIGRTGLHADFVTSLLRVRWAGLTVYCRPLAVSVRSEDRQPAPAERPGPKKPAKRRRHVPISELLDLLRRSRSAIWTYAVGLLRAVIVEQLEAEIEGGFDQPHLTGQAFGYYQAALAAVPAVVGRVNYIPDYTGASLNGALKASIALPVYKWLYRSIVLLWQLPIKDIVRMTIGSNKGEQDAQ